MSWVRPNRSTLIQRARDDIDTRLPGADSRLRHSVLNVLATVHGGAMDGLYGALADTANFLPDRTGEALVIRWASIFGLTRKAAEAATGTVTLTGDNGVTIDAGTVLLRSDGARYLVSADVTIAAGMAAAEVIAEGLGTGAAMEAGQTLAFASPVAGVAAIATVTAPGIEGGVDQESIESLRGRLLQKLRSPVRGGAASDYVFWAVEVPEVTRAWVYENWNGLGTVKVLFVCDGRDDIIPAAGDVTAVTTWIADRRPVCAAVTVAAPTAAPRAFDIDLTPDTPQVRAAVDASLRDLIAREAEPGGTLLISHIREAISISAGETNHVLNSPTADVVAAAGEITTMGDIAW